MFKNTVAKFAVLGLIFSLCAPCCLASAQQSEKPTLLRFETADLVQQIHNATIPASDRPAIQNLLTKIKEKQIKEFADVQTVRDLYDFIMEASSKNPFDAYNWLVTLAPQLGISEEDAFDTMSPVLREVFKEYGAFVLNLLELYGFPEEVRPTIANKIMKEAYPDFFQW